MGYGSGGRYWNLGLSDPGRLSATARQIRWLGKLTGISHAGRGLTREQASDLIDEAIRLKEARREGITGMADGMYAACLRKAIAAANAAGEAWLAANPRPLFGVHDPESGETVGVHGVVGSAYITWPKSSGAFRQWAEKHLYDGQRTHLPISHRFADRMERDLLLACELAAFEVLRESGAVGDIRLLVRCAEPPETLPAAA